MKRPTAGRIVGVAGLALLLASWAGIYLGTCILPEAWVPWVWLVAIVAAPAPIVAGVVAGRMHSKRWYWLVAVGCLSLAILLAAVAD